MMKKYDHKEYKIKTRIDYGNPKGIVSNMKN